ncbi:Hypothetical predicted protein, partial [Scomber scombrus]
AGSIKAPKPPPKVAAKRSSPPVVEEEGSWHQQGTSNMLPQQETTELNILDLSSNVLTPNHFSLRSKRLLVPTNQSKDLDVK